jgi:hypothetical protein
MANDGRVDAQAIIDAKDARNKKEQEQQIAFVKAESMEVLDWKSENIDKLAEALSKVQGEYEGVAKNQANTFYSKSGKPSYADLHAVQNAVFPILSKYGLSVSQGNEIIPSAVCVTTLLMHKSGQWLRSKIKLPLEKVTAQGVGGAVTYGRRYGLSAIVGTAQHDADGNDC